MPAGSGGPYGRMLCLRDGVGGPSLATSAVRVMILFMMIHNNVTVLATICA